MTNRLDEFSKSLAEESVPRRESLRRLGLVLAGAVLGPLGMESALAGRSSRTSRRQTDPCKAFCTCRNKRQNNDCLAACRACNNDPSQMCGACGSYVCCGNGTVCCGDYCADLDGDPYNCGACGYACDEPGPYEYGACIDGNCEYACAEETLRCDGSCTPVYWDPNNCGDCGTVCPPEVPYCVWGTCSFCPPELFPCGSGCCPYGYSCVDGVCQAPPSEPCTPDHAYWPNC